MDSENDLLATFADFPFDGPRRPWVLRDRKIADILANITLESEKVGYNPETDTNWCHLPMELREECIKEMDFKTRTHMRASSSIEKSYVDAHIYHFDKAIYDSETLVKAKKVVIENVPINNLKHIALHLIEKWSENDVKIGTMCHLHSGKIGQKVNGEKKYHGARMANKTKAVYLEVDFRRHSGGAGEFIVKVIRNPDFCDDAPNGN